MDFFTSGMFWFAEGVLTCLMVLGFKAWMEDRGRPMPIWKWLLFGLWVMLAGFTLAFVGTCIGENEPDAALKGGVLFGAVTVVSGVDLLHHVKIQLQDLGILGVKSLVGLRKAFNALIILPITHEISPAGKEHFGAGISAVRGSCLFVSGLGHRPFLAVKGLVCALIGGPSGVGHGVFGIRITEHSQASSARQGTGRARGFQELSPV